MIVNGKDLLEAAPIADMASEKRREHGVSHGLSEAGYDIRIKQEVEFRGHPGGVSSVIVDGEHRLGRFTIASAIERFQMPPDLVGIVHDKSTWARRGLSVFNTVVEPGWEGWLTLELVYHGSGKLHIPAGAGIAQVVFTRTTCPMQYSGKYQGQPDKPVAAIMEGDG